MTSSISSPRRDLADISPRTHLTSTTLDLPPAVGADDAGDAVVEDEFDVVGEGFEAGEFEAGEFQGRPPPCRKLHIRMMMRGVGDNLSQYGGEDSAWRITSTGTVCGLSEQYHTIPNADNAFPALPCHLLFSVIGLGKLQCAVAGIITRMWGGGSGVRGSWSGGGEDGQEGGQGCVRGCPSSWLHMFAIGGEDFGELMEKM